MIEAAFREIYEETGIGKEDIDLGSVVWFGEFDLILSGNPVHMKQQFIVARTRQSPNFFLKNLTEEEKGVVEKLEWFSLEKIKKSTEIIYPLVLSEYLPAIITGEYPKEPLKLDL